MLLSSCLQAKTLWKLISEDYDLRWGTFVFWWFFAYLKVSCAKFFIMIRENLFPRSVFYEKRRQNQQILFEKLIPRKFLPAEVPPSDSLHQR